MIVEVAEEFLHKLGYEVLVARGGEQALEVYSAHTDKIDLVILDMTMKDMGGSETYDKIKEINPDAKVLLSSGYTIEGQPTEILERGCNGFIQKPFTIGELSRIIGEILQRE